MAKLVAVCRDEEFPFERRQIPLMIEETLTMVMEIPETIISAECVTSADVAQFIKRYSCLSHGEMNTALMVEQKELFTLLSVSVPCVGCRRSVERLYNQLWESGQPAIEPLIITASGVLTLSESFLIDAKLIYALFYIHGSHLNDVVDTIPKSRRNRRCILHSLETHKARASGSWMDVWDLLSQECRDEVVLIDSDSLLDTLENYLRKHRFCSECKSKVLKAYSILAGDIDGDAEKGYCASLYEGLKSCPKERHIHVVCETDFIAHLIGRAEPELAGGRRERHARTIDIAQEEVLTCLGIHLWDRLHRLWQKLRAEEQTWQMLFYLGVEALRKSFETAVEEKQGITQLERVVEEISEAERAKEQRKENKRLKKKKRKENKAKEKEISEEKIVEIVEEEEEEKCASNSNAGDYDDSCDGSEKSSSELVVSPRKIDEEEDDDEEEGDGNSYDVHSDVSPKLSPVTTKISEETTSSQSKESSICSDSKESPESLPSPKCKESTASTTATSTCNDRDDDDTTCKHNGEESDKSDKNVSNGNSAQCKSTPSYKCKNGYNSCSSKDSSTLTVDSNSNNQKGCHQENVSKTAETCHSKHQAGGEDTCPIKGCNPCKCDKETKTLYPNNSKTRNGFINHNNQSSDYRTNNSNHYKLHGGHKKNGYIDCRNCSPVGPRFSRYEDQNRWKSNSNEYVDVYDKFHNVNGGVNGRGRGKNRKGGRKEQPSPGGHVCQSGPWNRKNEQNTGQGKSSGSNGSASQTRGGQEASPPEVEDEDELRLLQSMGWTSEDSLGISEQEIQEFKANRSEVTVQREQLRNKLREQFRSLSINPVGSQCGF